MNRNFYDEQMYDSYERGLFPYIWWTFFPPYYPMPPFQGPPPPPHGRPPMSPMPPQPRPQPPRPMPYDMNRISVGSDETIYEDRLF